MWIDTITTPLDQKNEKKLIEGRTVIVIDILRVCTSIITALEAGASQIYPTLSVKEAFEQKEKMIKEGEPADNILLCGERLGLRVEGFDLGNSPSEYTPERVGGKTLIVSSTNGTKAMKRSLVTGCVAVGSFLNAKAAAEFAVERGKDLVINLSGREEDFSYEDAVGAGMIIDNIMSIKEAEKGKDAPVALSDSSAMALALYNLHQDNLKGMFAETFHGRYLISLGLGGDFEYCSRTDVYDKVPLLGEDGFISNF